MLPVARSITLSLGHNVAWCISTTLDGELQLQEMAKTGLLAKVEKRGWREVTENGEGKRKEEQEMDELKRKCRTRAKRCEHAGTVIKEGRSLEKRVEWGERESLIVGAWLLGDQGCCRLALER